MAWGSCYSPDFRAISLTGAGVPGTLTQANDRRLVEGATNAQNFTFVADSLDTGRYALRCDPSATTISFALANMATTPRYSGLLLRFKTPATINTITVMVQMQCSTSTDNVRVRFTAAGLLSYSFNGGTTFTDTAITLNTSTVYGLEVFVDWNTGTTHTLKIRLNGVEVVNTTGGAAIVTGANPLIGTATAAGNVVDYADMVTYNDVAQYAAMSDWRVYGVEPTADGTHNFTDNDFQNAAAANITAANVAGLNTWDYVNDAPGAAPDVTAFVQQVVLRATSYMEWVLNTSTIPVTTGTPVLVCLAAAMHPVAAATANTVAFRLNSGGNLSTEAAIDTSLVSNTLEYRKHHYTTEPGSGAAWTLAMVRALRARFGYSNDATPPPALDSIMAFVVVPTSQPSRPAVQPLNVSVNRSYSW